MAHPESTKPPPYGTSGAPQTPFSGTPIRLSLPQFALPSYPVALMPVRPSRAKYFWALIPLTLLGGVGGYLLAPRGGVLELSVRPPDAHLAIDGVPVNGSSPFRIKKPPGVHRLTVSRPGYVAYAQDILITSRQQGQMDIALLPSADTGFKLTSRPAGGLVWLDGQPLVLDRDGKQATTDVIAPGIPPGPHQIEINGIPGFLPWQARFSQEPGRTVVLHAELVPASASGAASGSASLPPVSRPSTRAAVSAPSAVDDSTREQRMDGEGRSPPAAGPVATGDDPFDKPAPTQATPEANPAPSESDGRRPAAAANCVATIGSSPPAELLIDGKSTGQNTPLVNFEIPCGTHRLTFKNEDLLIERNERVTLTPGRPYKKTFRLVSDDLF